MRPSTLTNSVDWGLPNDYRTGQNIARSCDRCDKKVGQLGGCYAKRGDYHLCFECFDEVFGQKTLKEKAGWDA